MPTPAQHAELATLAARLDAAAHGEKVALVEAAASGMGVTPATIHRWLCDHRHSDRKRRSDAGKFCFTREEAVQVAGVVKEGLRDSGQQIITLMDAVAWCRANGLIRAERVDKATGEVTPLSEASIARALKHYKLDARTVRQPTPHQSLSSPHPNWCWQVDASVCVLFYLPGGQATGKDYALVPLNKAVHYKNKPENLAAIERFRVIRYVATDHCSGVLRVKYYPHSESGEHTVAFLAWLMAGKGNLADPFHGRPFIVMVDPGATASGLVRRFCQQVGTRLIVNKAHNPRAKGQVENGNHLWEMRFESGLKFQRDRVPDFAALNDMAATYQLWFNANKRHGRHGKTRFAKWLEITPDQLIVTAPEAQLLKLATGKPETPKVAGDLTVRFAGQKWSVRDVPDVVIGRAVTVCWAPLTEGGAVALVDQRTEDGRQKTVQYPLEAVLKGEHGFPVNAATIGVEFKSPPDTVAVENAKELSRVASGTSTLAEDEAARKQKGFVPFGGAMNPFKTAESAAPVTYLPRIGKAMEPFAIETAARKLNVVEAAAAMKAAMGDAWHVEMFDWLARRYPEGLTEDVLERLIGDQESGVRCQVSGG